MNYTSCDIAYHYGYILGIMFQKYKLLKQKETWVLWFERFTESKNINMSARMERYYRHFYKVVENYPKLKSCGEPFYKLKSKLNDFKKAIALYPEYTRYFK